MNMLPSENYIPYFDTILVADMFYSLTQSAQTLNFLKKQQQNGSRIFIADGERPFAPTKSIQMLEEEIIPVNFDLEGVTERRVRVGTLQVDGDCS